MVASLLRLRWVFGHNHFNLRRRFLSTAPYTTFDYNSFEAVCKVKIKEDKTTAVRVADSLHIKTFNTDPNLSNLWTSSLG